MKHEPFFTPTVGRDPVTGRFTSIRPWGSPSPREAKIENVLRVIADELRRENSNTQDVVEAVNRLNANVAEFIRRLEMKMETDALRRKEDEYERRNRPPVMVEGGGQARRAKPAVPEKKPGMLEKFSGVRAGLVGGATAGIVPGVIKKFGMGAIGLLVKRLVPLAGLIGLGVGVKKLADDYPKDTPEYKRIASEPRSKVPLEIVKYFAKLTGFFIAEAFREFRGPKVTHEEIEKTRRMTGTKPIAELPGDLLRGLGSYLKKNWQRDLGRGATTILRGKFAGIEEVWKWLKKRAAPVPGSIDTAQSPLGALGDYLKKNTLRDVKSSADAVVKPFTDSWDKIQKFLKAMSPFGTSEQKPTGPQRGPMGVPAPEGMIPFLFGKKNAEKRELPKLDFKKAVFLPPTFVVSDRSDIEEFLKKQTAAKKITPQVGNILKAQREQVEKNNRFLPLGQMQFAQDNRSTTSVSDNSTNILGFASPLADYLPL